MRKSSFSLQTQNSEPLIVVEESEIEVIPEKEIEQNNSNDGSSSEESPTNFMNPYLLCPWRDARETRKHSLPTPQCSGITASQVRRLSERGEGNSGPGPRQTEFLATLSSSIAPTPGGRRHSVVTISKVPSNLIGRMRRESVAAFPSPARILPMRRESVAGPPSTEPRGSVHNLQLDIMDDIVQARKVRMKMWNTSSEKVCEVQPLDEAGGVQKYTSAAAARRYSDFVGTTLAPIPSCSKRRASEMPPARTPSGSSPTSACKLTTGIICTNTDLISILSSLTSSATEINQYEVPKQEKKAAEQKRSRMKTNRSNSFDVSILHGTGNKIQQPENKPQPSPTNWFVKRHQPMSTKNTNEIDTKPIPQVTLTLEDDSKEASATKKGKEKNKVVWDGRSGSIVDAQVLGNAIEDFLRRPSDCNESSSNNVTPNVSPNKGAIPKPTKPSTKPKSGWFSGKPEEDTPQTCESSICSTLKDLFVK